MKFNLFARLYAIVSTIFGLGFIFAPASLLSIYGVDTEAPLRYIGQLFGASLISLAALAWMIRDAEESIMRQSIVMALLIGEIAGFVLAIIGQLNGVLNVLGWSVVAVYLLFSVGLAYFRFNRASR